MKYIPYGIISKQSALDELKAWCLTGDKPLPEHVLTKIHEAIVALWPLWCQTFCSTLIQVLVWHHVGTPGLYLNQSYLTVNRTLINSLTPERNGRHFAGGILNEFFVKTKNKANLRDLIAATGLVILLKLDEIHRFFSPCDLEIWWMTPKNNRSPLLCYFKFLHHFIAIGEFKLELQSGNAQFGSK